MSAIPSYQDFLRAKIPVKDDDAAVRSVFVLRDPHARPHQDLATQWLVEGERRALFASFGLGKTRVQLRAVASIIAAHGGRGLIVLPLGVRQEFTRDAAAIGIEIRFIRRIEEAGETGLYMTNYETVRDGKLDPAHFIACSLDEASVLRGFGGTKTFREFMRLFEAVRFKFVATATPSPNEYIELLSYAAFLGVMDVGQAKAQPLDANILTPRGWRKMGDIQAGDLVIAGDGTPTKVLGVFPQGVRQAFRVTFSDGGSTECDADHLWLTTTHYERNNERRYLQRTGLGNDGSRKGTFASVRTTAEIAASLTTPAGKNHAIPLTGAVEYEGRDLPIHPWVLGALIGDGCLRETSVTFSTADQWMLENMGALVPAGLGFRETSPGSQDYTISTTPGRQGGSGWGANKLLSGLRALGLLGKRSWEKVIPADYLYSSVSDRLALLRGLMDTDGTISGDGQTTLCTVSRELAEQTVELVRSLGGLATIREGSICDLTAHQSHIVEIRLAANPFSLPRKADKHNGRTTRALSRYIVSVEPSEEKPCQCIAVEHPDRLYVTDDFAVTHNTRFFKRDSTNADKLTLHPHKAEEFWFWVSSWALFIQRPSDLGYSDEGYALPELRVHYHAVQTDLIGKEADRGGQLMLIRDHAIGVQGAAKEKRDTLPARIEAMKAILSAEPDEHFLIWHDLEDERRAIEKAVPGVVSVFGSQDLGEREKRIIDFSNGAFKYLAAKPVIAGSGCNFQRHCSKAIFLGIGFKFNDFIQAVHRIQRFLQTRTVEIHIIHAESEQAILRTLLRKWEQHKVMVQKMSDIIKEFGLSHAAMAKALERSIGCKRIEVSADKYRLVNADCVEETQRMESDSVGLIVTSIPFSTQYEYSPSYNDFGHTDDDAHFWRQMDYLVPQLFRVLKPGRDAAIHVKDRIIPGGVSDLGFQTLSTFSYDCIAAFKKHGFAYLGEKTITTDVVRENNQTYRLGWTEQCKDGSRMGFGVPEKLLLFRKPPSSRDNGYADEMVVKAKKWRVDAREAHFEKDPETGEDVFVEAKPGYWLNPDGYSRGRWQLDAHAYTRSSGDRLITSDELIGFEASDVFKKWKAFSLQTVYNFEHHVQICEAFEERGRLPADFMLMPPHSRHPDVWTDITRMLSANTLQSARGAELHLCPLQFDIVDRAINQWSNPGDVVFDPFGGLMTVPMRAVKFGRIGWGVELNHRYFLDGVAYVEAEARKIDVPTLFDALTAEAAGRIADTIATAAE